MLVDSLQYGLRRITMLFDSYDLGTISPMLLNNLQYDLGTISHMLLNNLQYDLGTISPILLNNLQYD